MRRNWIITLALASCILLNMPHSAQAFRPIMDDWQAYYEVCQPLVTLDCDACHLNGTFAYNPYGTALKDRLDLGMTRIEAFVDAENVDSDGGGATNGQEIVVNCTEPGDPGDDPTVPNDEATWSMVKALFK